MRGQPATRISLRSRRSAPLSRWPRLSTEELGPRARETNWQATPQSRGRAQARGHHASDLERSERIPLDSGTIDYRLRAFPEGNSFSKSADSRRQRVPLGRGRATPRFSLRHAHRVGSGTGHSGARLPDAKLRLARIGQTAERTMTPAGRSLFKNRGLVPPQLAPVGKNATSRARRSL